jgi:predicted acyl esterase
VDYVMLAMRDGVRLATVVIRPRAAGHFQRS